MDKTVEMSEKEVSRIRVLESVIRRELSQSRAAVELGISSRHIRRLVKRYLKDGAAGLIHGNRGKTGHHRMDDRLKGSVIGLIHTQYQGFGPTLIAEKLEERNGIRVSDESVRQLMISEGVWKLRRKRRVTIHPTRPRVACFGELIQIDGSEHDWFEGRSPMCTLLVMVDDATGTLLGLHFAQSESFFGYTKVIRPYFEKYGKPKAFYSDKHSIFHQNQERMQPGTDQTQFGRALEELGIKLICASSPQAKGRVERVNQTLQDRLVKEMRLLEIDTIEAANDWLPEYVDTYNKQFTVTARSPVDAHTPLQEGENLDLIFCKKIKKTLSRNLSFQWNKVLYQIKPKQSAYALVKTKVTVLEDSEGQITVLGRSGRLEFEPFDVHNKNTTVVSSKELATSVRRSSDTKPAPDHPWRHGFQRPTSNTINPKADISILSDNRTF